MRGELGRTQGTSEAKSVPCSAAVRRLRTRIGRQSSVRDLEWGKDATALDDATGVSLRSETARFLAEEQERCRRTLDAVVNLLCVLIPFYGTLYVALQVFWATVGIAFAFVAVLAIKLALRHAVSTRLLTHCLAAACLVALVAIVFSMGGTQSPVIVWLCLAPVVAMGVGRARDGLVWIGITVAAIAFAYATDLVGFTPPQMTTWLRSLYDASVVAGFACAVATIFYLRDRLMYGGLRDATLTQAREQTRQLQLAADRTEREVLQRDRYLGLLVDELCVPNTEILGISSRIIPQVDSELRWTLQELHCRGEEVQTFLSVAREQVHSAAACVLNPLSVRVLVDELRQEFQAQAQAVGLDFAIEATQEVGEAFLGDYFAVREMLACLVRNALRFTRQGHIHITLRVFNDELELLVEDTGPGLKRGERTRVVEFFAQAPDGPHRWRRHLGLDLVLCSRMLSNLQGKLTLRSERDRGTTFLLQLPFVQLRRRVQRTPLAQSDDQSLAA